MFVGSWIQKFWEKHGSRMAWERKAVPVELRKQRRNRKDMVPFPSPGTLYLIKFPISTSSPTN